MAEAIIDRGIGAARALVLHDGEVISAHLERDDLLLRAGAVHVGRLTTILEAGRRGIVRLGASEALLEPIPKVSEGALLRVEVVREAVPETARPRLAKVVAVSGPTLAVGQIDAGPDLEARLRAAGHRITRVSHHEPDRLEAAGWGEQVEAARTGHIGFHGGLLTISPTPAMTLIDVDGPGDPVVLAESAAKAVAVAIVRFDISGSIGVDFPTLAGKAARARLDAIIDATLPQPFERTATNGFGFMQIIRPRLRASFVESVRAPGFFALELVRRAARESPGACTLLAHPAIIAWLQARETIITALARSIGGAVRLQADAAGSRTGGDVIHG